MSRPHPPTTTRPARRLVAATAPALLGLAVLAAPVAAGTAGAAPAQHGASAAAAPATAPSPDGTLSTTTPTVTQGAPITFTYGTTQADFESTNWIGIYSDPGCGPVDDAYVCPSTTYQYTPATTGGLTFATSSLSPGKYVAYYLYDNEYDSLATPVPFTIAAVKPVAAPVYASTLTATGLHDPEGVAEGTDGRVWVADTGANRIEELSGSTGRVIRTIGHRGSGKGELRAPRAVAVSGRRVWVADTGNNRVEEYTTDGTWVRTIGGAGTGAGRFESPEGVTVAGEDVWVSDDGDNRLETFDRDTGAYRSTVTGDDISSPAGMYTTAEGDVWVAMQGQTDTALDGVVELSPTGTVLLALDSDNTTQYGGFNDPTDVATDKAGHIFVAEPDLDYVQEFSATGVFLNEFGVKGRGTLSSPVGLTVTPAGRILVADSGNDRLVTFKES